MENRLFYTKEDIVSDLSISEKEAAEIIKALQKELKRSGHLVVRGRVPAAWYKQQKERGFLDIRQQEENIPITERRLLSIKNFCEYVGGIDKRTARSFVREQGLEIYIGSKMMVDRKRFDEWCEEQNRKGQNEN